MEKKIFELFQKPNLLRDYYLWNQALINTDKEFFTEMRQWFRNQLANNLSCYRLNETCTIETFFQTALTRDGYQTQEIKVNGVSIICMESKYFNVTYIPVSNSAKISLKSKINFLEDEELEHYNFKHFEFITYEALKQLEDSIEEQINCLYRFLFENEKNLYKDILLYRRIVNKIVIEVTDLQKKLPRFYYREKFLIRFEEENIIFSITSDKRWFRPKEYILPKYKWEEGAQKLIDDYNRKINKQIKYILPDLQATAERLLMQSKGKRCREFDREDVIAQAYNSLYVEMLLSLLYPNRKEIDKYIWQTKKLFQLQYHTLEEYKQLLDKEVGNFKSELKANTLTVRFELFKVNFVQREDNICVTFKAYPEAIKYFPDLFPIKREMRINHEGLNINKLIDNNSSLNIYYYRAKEQEATVLNGYDQQQYLNALKTIVDSFSCLIGDKSINRDLKYRLCLTIPNPGKIRLYVQCPFFFTRFFYDTSLYKDFELSSFETDYKLWLSEWIMKELKKYILAIKSISE